MYTYQLNFKKPIETVTYPQGEFSLLSKCGPVEVIEQYFKPDNTLTLYATESEDAHEIYYILEGEMHGTLDGVEVTLKSGDTFQLNQLAEDLFFETETGVRFLCITTHATFHHLSNVIYDLHQTVKKIEDKDPYTKEHSIRVQDFAYKIAQKMHLPQDRLEPLCLAALFHDIGKLDVPEYILNKPEKLTSEEFDEIKKHPDNGRRMVVGTIMDHASQCIAEHHERLDGSGYPSGLKGDQICIEARIIAVADVFDAMTTDRAYRSRLSEEEAMGELESKTGICYDSLVVEALKAVLSEQKKD